MLLHMRMINGSRRQISVAAAHYVHAKQINDAAADYMQVDKESSVSAAK